MATRGLAEVYSPTDDSWRVVPQPNADFDRATLDLLPDGSVLLVAARDLQLLKPRTGRWVSAGRPEFARWGHATGWLPDGKALILVGGGAPHDTEGNYIQPKTDGKTPPVRLDTATGKWTVVNNYVPDYRQMHAVRAPNGSGLLLIGGKAGYGDGLHGASRLTPTKGP